ncbi:interferon regulatory factor 3 [Chelonoidis abingdonii]|uniref:interferon regulatory factor 3 n=1 Tax=Chelonoidis abingdonii TaxID=106734 RepID=UPI003F498E34
MGTPKPLIVPWLRKKLDNGCYPGVRWLDQGRTQFRVPWKHGLRQDASTEDFQLFRDWAIDSGSYRPEHDAPAPSVWKRNFRSALNRKPGIQVLRDHSSDSADPHKVYEILPEGARAGVDEAPSAAVGGTEADASSQLLDQSGGGFSSSQDEELDDILNALALSSPDEDAPGPAQAPGASYASDTATGGALSLGLGDFPPLEPAPSSLEQLLGSNVLMTFFEVAGVYYRGRLVGRPLMALSWLQPLSPGNRFRKGGAGNPANTNPLPPQVVPTALQTLHQMSQAGGASSLRAEELDLQISDSLGEARLLEALRVWEERMESQPYG